ncbi:GNAT family N-acetyltransferase [Sphingomonas sp. Tas61C01]|uniref:GNAT family N-acetyltransferase n=1 Tax=Sphingomonas sp. Tas61C01 TaxID=3458297 RepID=UPI00403EDC38
MTGSPVWRLRRASTADAPAVAMVAQASFLETFAGILAGADIVAHCGKNSSPAAFAAWAGDPRAAVTLAEHADGAAPIGYTLLVPPDLPIALSSTDIELRRIYALSLAHGTGLGRAMMQRAIDDARGMGMTRLLLGVLGRNTRARAFYERGGFAVVGERQYLVGSTLYDDLVYALDL